MICLSLSIDNLKVIDWFFTDGRAGVSCGATHWPDSVRILCDFSVVSVDLLQWITLVCVCVCVLNERKEEESIQFRSQSWNAFFSSIERAALPTNIDGSPN